MLDLNFVCEDEKLNFKFSQYGITDWDSLQEVIGKCQRAHERAQKVEMQRIEEENQNA